jgi:kynurenine 3-monooxygenase
MRDQPVNIVGAGLAGALLAVLLARRGLKINIFEKRADPRQSQPEGGRSINLALAARGIRVLERAGVMERVRPLLISMRGRRIHELSGAPALLPYGQRDHEVIYSIERTALNHLLIQEAAGQSGVTLRFGQPCLGVDIGRNALRLHDGISGEEYEVPLAPTIAADGGGSAVRRSLVAAGLVADSEELLDHDYKELTIPPVAGRYALEPDALHVWPRGGFMLIALPNPDLTFTATLFLPREGTESFASLQSPEAVQAFFTRHFPDAAPLIPALLTEFFQNPQGLLGTVRTTPWHLDGKVVLIGDAAHAIVPFHGQGMNAAFEDCAALDELVASHRDWSSAFDAFETERRPHADAIAQMALENYVEMRDTVRDPAFARQKALSLELERRFPDRFIPRYSMVMFHPEIPYAEALRRGAVQAEILQMLDARRTSGGEADYALAARLVNERLPSRRGKLRPLP